MTVDAAKPLLALEGLEVAYGGIQAVRGIDLFVGKGELVCLIGANGAGKTTTLKGITGLQPVSGGTVRYEGEDVTGAPAFQLVRRGLAMVPEGRGVFGGLTIEETGGGDALMIEPIRLAWLVPENAFFPVAIS